MIVALTFISPKKDFYFDNIGKQTEDILNYYIASVETFFLPNNDEYKDDEDYESDVSINYRLKNIISSRTSNYSARSNKSLENLNSERILEEVDQAKAYVKKLENIFYEEKDNFWSAEISAVQEESGEHDISKSTSRVERKYDVNDDKTLIDFNQTPSKSIIKNDNKSMKDVKKLDFALINLNFNEEDDKTILKSNSHRNLATGLNNSSSINNNTNMGGLASKARSTKTIVTDFISQNRSFSRQSEEEEWRDTITNLRNERLSTFNIDINKYLGSRVLEKRFGTQKSRKRTQSFGKGVTKIRTYSGNMLSRDESMKSILSDENNKSIDNSKLKISPKGKQQKSNTQNFHNPMNFQNFQQKLSDNSNRTRFSINTDCLLKLEAFQSKLNTMDKKSSHFFKPVSAMKTEYLESHGLLEFTHEMTNKVMQLENIISQQKEKLHIHKIHNTKLLMEVKDLKEQNNIIQSQLEIQKQKNYAHTAFEEELIREKEDKEKIKAENNLLISQIEEKINFIKKTEKEHFNEKEEFKEIINYLKNETKASFNLKKENEDLKKTLNDTLNQVKNEESNLLSQKIYFLSKEIEDVKKEKGLLSWKVDYLNSENHKKSDTIKDLIKETNNAKNYIHHAKQSITNPITSRGATIDFENIEDNEEVVPVHPKDSLKQTLIQDAKRFSVKSLNKLKPKSGAQYKSKLNLVLSDEILPEIKECDSPKKKQRKNTFSQNSSKSSYSSRNSSQDIKEYSLNEYGIIDNLDKKSESESDEGICLRKVSHLDSDDQIISMDKTKVNTIVDQINKKESENLIKSPYRITVGDILSTPNENNFKIELNTIASTKNLHIIAEESETFPSMINNSNKQYYSTSTINNMKGSHLLFDLKLKQEFKKLKEDKIASDEKISCLEEENTNLKKKLIAVNHDFLIFKETKLNEICRLNDEISDLMNKNQNIQTDKQYSKELLSQLLIEKDEFANKQLAMFNHYELKLKEYNDSNEAIKNKYAGLIKNSINDANRQNSIATNFIHQGELNNEEVISLIKLIQSKNDEISSLNKLLLEYKTNLNNKNNDYNQLVNTLENERLKYKNDNGLLLKQLSTLAINFNELQNDFMLRLNNE